MSNLKRKHRNSLESMLRGAVTIGDAFGLSYYDRVYDGLVTCYDYKKNQKVKEREKSLHTVFISHSINDFQRIFSDLDKAIGGYIHEHPELSHVRNSGVFLESE